MHRPTTVLKYLFVIAAVSTLAAHFPLLADAQEKSTSPDVDTLVSRMEQAQLENRARYRPYTVTREYRMYSAGSQQPSAEVVADINFVPPGSKTFDIKQTTGSSRGEKIVRNILQEESNSAPQYEHTSLTRDNYQFRYLGEDTIQGQHCYVLQLIPKRQEKDLVKGRAWIDAHTYLVRRVQGDLSKSPSWWLKGVHVTLDFQDVEGMWLQTRTQANADVRFFGAHKLESDALRFRTAETVARKTAPRKASGGARPTRPIIVSGAAVLIRR